MSIEQQPKSYSQEARKSMYAWINGSLVTQSLLYDLNLLPEQLEEGSKDWIKMAIICNHMRAIYEEGKAFAAGAR